MGRMKGKNCQRRWAARVTGEKSNVQDQDTAFDTADVPIYSAAAKIAKRAKQS